MNKALAIDKTIDSTASASVRTRLRRIRRTFERVEVTQMSKDDSIANFVHEQNIERYRKLLQIPLDVQRRQAILTLLAQEETAEQEPIRANGLTVFH
jgi:hypothetical protein